MPEAVSGCLWCRYSAQGLREPPSEHQFAVETPVLESQQSESSCSHASGGLWEPAELSPEHHKTNRAPASHVGFYNTELASVEEECQHCAMDILNNVYSTLFAIQGHGGGKQ